MKNKILYALIGGMLISLIGIIWIQSAWIGGAIHARNKDFRFHVNLALNRVNAEIEKEETLFIMERKLGNVDSLLETLVVFDEEDSDAFRIDLKNAGKDVDTDRQIEIKIENEGNHTRVHSEIRRHTNAWVENEHRFEILEERQLGAERRMAKMQEAGQAKERHMKAMFRHLSYERMFGEKLKDRISPAELTKKIRLALSTEGILPQFEYAIFNRKKGDIEEGYVSQNFEPQSTDPLIKKTLFEGELNFMQDYEIWLQPKDKESYVWRGVKEMTLLSLLFTLMILFSFGASIYFILKQKKISQVKNDFINNMTHELKTPLASISLANSSITHPEVIDHPDEIRKYTGIIKEEENRINAHVERVLNIAALDRGEFELNHQELDFMEILQNAIRSMQLALDDKKGKFQLQHAGVDFRMKGDAFHLTNVCSNLLDNAIKYSNEGVEIQLRLTDLGKEIQLVVEDTGIGMTSREQKLAFDKFYRAETGNIHTQKGFGLGLSYVKSIIERHKGKIELKSTRGKGTIVTFELPKK